MISVISPANILFNLSEGLVEISISPESVQNKNCVCDKNFSQKIILLCVTTTNCILNVSEYSMKYSNNLSSKCQLRCVSGSSINIVSHEVLKSYKYKTKDNTSCSPSEIDSIGTIPRFPLSNFISGRPKDVDHFAIRV